MRSRRTVRLAMMLAALLFSVVPAAAITAQPVGAASRCDWAQFIADVTIPDGTRMGQGIAFTKTWRLKNIGTCTWTNSYALVLSSGAQMSGPSPLNLPTSVPPGQSVDLSVNMTAPSTVGHYIGYWKLSNASGVVFGLGSNADKAWWVEINVSGGPPPPPPNARDFDFGTSTSPVAPGYVQVTETTSYSAGAFGWTTASNAQSVNRSSQLDSLKRDFVMSGTSAPTFEVDLPNGNYAVTVTMGDQDAPHDNMIVKANGAVMLTDVDTAAGTYAIRTFNVAVSGGRLNLQFMDAGGLDPSWVVNGVSIAATSQPPSACDRAQFITDVTVPDGTRYVPGAALLKTWRLKNIGTCTWTPSYAMVFDLGEKMGGPDSVNLPQNVLPGQTVDVSVNLSAPSAAGSYRGYWKFQNADGVRFGLGADGSRSWWVDIKVSGAAATPTPTATQPASGTPTTTSTATPTPSTATSTVPPASCDRAQFIADVTVPDGTVFSPGTSFVKTWRLKNVGSCTWTTAYAMVFDIGEKMSGPDSVPMPRAVAPGQTVEVSANLAAPGAAGSYRGYWKFQNAGGIRFGLGSAGSKSWWVDIRVSGNPATATPTGTPAVTSTSTATPTGTSTATATPTVTATPTPIASCTDTSCWNQWVNTHYLFSFMYPPNSTLVSQTDTGGRINLPFAPGTNLLEKHLDVSIFEGASMCQSPQSQGPNPRIGTENVTFNGVPFLKETWTEAATSHRADYTAYSTVKGNACISLTFWLWSVAPEVMQTPPPRFDPVAETAVFTTIMSTYANR